MLPKEEEHSAQLWCRIVLDSVTIALMSNCAGSVIKYQLCWCLPCAHSFSYIELQGCMKGGGTFLYTCMILCTQTVQCCHNPLGDGMLVHHFTNMMNPCNVHVNNSCPTLAKILDLFSIYVFSFLFCFIPLCSVHIHRCT